jgi:hypothetical protein
MQNFGNSIRRNFEKSPGTVSIMKSRIPQWTGRGARRVEDKECVQNFCSKTSKTRKKTEI